MPRRFFASALFAIGVSICANAQEVATAPVELQGTVDAIAKEVAQIRGLPFKRGVPAERQSTAQFQEYLRRKIDEVVPASILLNYGRIVRTLGLYRGPAIDDYSAMMTSVMASQAGAYYDPKQQRFYVLMSRMPELMQGVLYSHELYHALQDQYFDLSRFLEPAGGKRVLDSDQAMARQAVVEGEATYVMNLWALQKAMKSIPPREMLTQIIAIQTGMTMEQMRASMKQPQVADLVGADLQEAMKATESIPPFLLDEMIGAYLKGMAFVFAIQAQGWDTVASLYRDRPPLSTEQILHPEKWTAGEKPVTFEWPDFASVAALKSWQLLDSDVLGEFRWRSVFRENGQAAVAESASAGWGGDRYAVFKRKDSDAMLLLWRTSWDSAAEATEFADAYRRVLAVKYAEHPAATRLLQQGTEVLIVEGGEEATMDALVKVVQGARKRT